MVTLLPDEMPGGWSGFVEEHWESKPKVLRSALKRPASLGRELFSAAIAATANGETPELRYVAAGKGKVRASRTMPVPADRGFSGYLKRAAAESRCRDITFVLNSVQASSAPLFDASVQFLSGLFDIIGTPLETEDVIFVTRSRLSVLGMHRDMYANFIFVAEGKKTFLLWPPDAVPGRPIGVPHSVFEKMRPLGEVVELEAGDMLFMPTGTYHCTVQDGFSVHLSMVVSSVDEATGRFFWSELQPFFHGCFDVPGGMSFLEKPRDLMFRETPGALTAPLREALARAARAEETVRAALVRTQSAGGFRAAPAETPHPPIRRSDWVQAKPSSLRLSTAGSDLLVGAHGQLYRCPAHPLLVAMLETLVTGASYRVGELLRRFTGSATIDGEEVYLDARWVLLFLQNLCQARWLRVVSPHTARKTMGRSD